jgi:hypothetical protein
LGLFEFSAMPVRFGAEARTRRKHQSRSTPLVNTQRPQLGGSALVLTQISNLFLAGASPDSEWELMPGLKLSTNLDRLKEFLTPEFRSSIGILACSSLISSQHFVFAEFSAEDIKSFLPTRQANLRLPRCFSNWCSCGCAGFSAPPG